MASGGSGDALVGAVVLGSVGVVLGLTLDVLAIVAQTRPRTDDGRLPAGWLATQYAAGITHLVAGGVFLGLVDDTVPRLGISIPLMSVGALWTGLAISNSIKRKPKNPEPAIVPVVFRANSQLDVRTRHRLQNNDGWIVGVAVRF